jgi:hypothetical protein
MKQPKRPRDANQLAKFIVDLASGELDDKLTTDNKNPAAVALGRLGGIKGGKARAQALTSKEKSAIARGAARARWGKRKEEG